MTTESFDPKLEREQELGCVAGSKRPLLTGKKGHDSRLEEEQSALRAKTADKPRCRSW